MLHIVHDHSYPKETRSTFIKTEYVEENERDLPEYFQSSEPNTNKKIKTEYDWMESEQIMPTFSNSKPGPFTPGNMIGESSEGLSDPHWTTLIGQVPIKKEIFDSDELHREETNSRAHEDEEQAKFNIRRDFGNLKLFEGSVDQHMSSKHPQEMLYVGNPSDGCSEDQKLGSVKVESAESGEESDRERCGIHSMTSAELMVDKCTHERDRQGKCQMCEELKVAEGAEIAAEPGNVAEGAGITGEAVNAINGLRSSSCIVVCDEKLASVPENKHEFLEFCRENERSWQKVSSEMKMDRGSSGSTSYFVGKIYLCNLECMFHAMNKADMIWHFWNIHERCKHEYTIYEYRKSMSELHNNRRYCQLCLRGYVSKDGLAKHLRTHHRGQGVICVGKRPKSSPPSPEDFEIDTTVGVASSGTVNKPVEMVEVVDRVSIRRPKCDFTATGAAGNLALMNHLVSTHSRKYTFLKRKHGTATSSGTHQILTSLRACPKCEFVGVNIKTLKKHMLTKHTSLNARLCQ